MVRRAMVLYARPPLAGRVKTRLEPALSQEEALHLYEAMLADSIERMARAAGDPLVPFELSLAWSEPFAASGEIAGLLGRMRQEVQSGGDLGERMTATLQSRLQGGFQEVALIGSDSPNLPLEYVRQAFEALGKADLVIGAAADGGYYLLGARRLHPEIFRRMPWGTDQVLPITLQRVRSGGVGCHQLPAWYDVDTPADVARLWRDLQHMKAKGAPDLPRRTWRALATLVPGRL